ncbi:MULTISPECIES: hypothetical protein [Amycolatopsis]|uniref:hypothetical protein n=1 Tax=Amycolatopsis TaxID=1813 RepID=UPI0007DFC6EC|nr:MULTISPECIES: hypothetical protein [Amycolatopsis]OAP21102.1 hypothetical protein A4R44_08077 [Amycolatopsis sp. M39]
MPVDAVLFARSGPATGWLATVAAEFAPGLGPVVAVLRRRFPGHVAAVATAVSRLSLVSTALVAALGQWLPPQPSGAEALAIALVVGSACHRLRPRPAFAQAVLGGVATVLGSPTALFAAAAAVAWGAALAVGLLLRDADARAGAAAARRTVAARA